MTMLSPDFKELFEKVPAAFLVLDDQLNIVAASERYLQLTSKKREKIFGENIFKVFPDNPADADASGVTNLRRSLQSVLKNQVPDVMDIQRYDIKLEEEDIFSVRYWNPMNVPVLDSSGNVKYIIHSVEDVTSFMQMKSEGKKQASENTDLKSVNQEMKEEIIRRSKDVELANKKLLVINQELTNKSEELRRSNAELANFAMIASHDIQAPFRIVGSYLSIIEEKLEQEGFMPQLQKNFEKIYAARERIKSLLDDLLQFAMVTRVESSFEDVDLNSVFNDVLTNLEMNIKDKNAQILLKGKFPVVKGERTQLLQLFQNLLANAIKFNTGQPVVNVEVTIDKENYLFTIKDNGVGIDAEFFKKIFEVFQRLNAQSEFPGTGLGLAICKKIVEHHNGKIWVQSKVGEGTTFFVTLPRLGNEN